LPRVSAATRSASALASVTIAAASPSASRCFFWYSPGAFALPRAAAGLVELRLDAGAAMIQRVDQFPVGADIDDDADENHEGDGDPEFGSLIVSNMSGS